MHTSLRQWKQAGQKNKRAKKGKFQQTQQWPQVTAGDHGLNFGKLKKIYYPEEMHCE